jgi:hypothetical protein
MRALDNAGIDPVAHLHAAHKTAACTVGPTLRLALIDANNDKIFYKLMIDLPNAGLQPPNALTGVCHRQAAGRTMREERRRTNICSATCSLKVNYEFNLDQSEESTKERGNVHRVGF